MINKEIHKIKSLDALTQLLDNHYKADEIPFSKSLLSKIVSLSGNNNIIVNENLAGGTTGSPTQLDYGVNVITPSADGEYFILPSPETGKEVIIVQAGTFLTSYDYYVLPPNSVSKINEQEDGAACFVSKGETRAVFTCVQNPNVSIWVTNLQRTNVVVPLGSVTIAHTNAGGDTTWSGNTNTGTSGDNYSIGSASGFTVTGSSDGFSIVSPTELYILKGFRVNTNIAVSAELDLSIVTLISHILDEDSLTNTTVNQAMNITNNVTDEQYDTGYNLSAGRVVQDILGSGGNSFYINVDPVAYGTNGLTWPTKRALSHKPQPTAPAHPSSGLCYGQGSFAFKFIIDTTMPSGPHTFDIDAIVDFPRK